VRSLVCPRKRAVLLVLFFGHVSLPASSGLSSPHTAARQARGGSYSLYRCRLYQAGKGVGLLLGAGVSWNLSCLRKRCRQPDCDRSRSYSVFTCVLLPRPQVRLCYLVR
jgi:hypothetical protein